MSKSKSRKTADVFDGEMMSNQVWLVTDLTSVEDIPDEATQADANAYFAGYSDPEVGIDEVRAAWQKEVQARVEADEELDQKIDKEGTDRADADKVLQDQIDEHAANHPQGSGWTPPTDEVTDLGLWFWQDNNAVYSGRAGFTPLSRSTVAEANSWFLHYTNQTEHKEDAIKAIIDALDEGGDFTLTVTHGALSATYPIFGYTDYDYSERIALDCKGDDYFAALDLVTGDASFLAEDVKTWPSDYELTFTVTKNVLTYEEMIEAEAEERIAGDEDLQTQIDGFGTHDHDEYAQKEHAHDYDVDYGIWTGAHSTTNYQERITPGQVGMLAQSVMYDATYCYVHRLMKDGTELADTPAEFVSMFDFPGRYFGLNDGSSYNRWIIKSVAIDAYDDDVVKIFFEQGSHETNNDSTRKWEDWVPSGGLDLEVELVYPKVATERDLLALTENVNLEVQERTAADAALSDRIDSLASSTPEYGTGQFGLLGDYLWKQTNTPLEGTAGYYPQGTQLVSTATHITFAYLNADGVDQMLSYAKVVEMLRDNIAVFLSMSSNTGSVQWRISGTVDEPNESRCKFTLDRDSIQSVGSLVDEDTGEWPNDGTKVLTYHAYVQVESELNKKLNKAGDDLTGDITIKPTTTKRWIGFKNFPPKNPDGSNDTQEAFGTQIDIDTLNTWKSRFKVTSRYGDIMMISGGGGPQVNIGPINTMSDPDDPANEKKGVPLALSWTPTEDSHAVSRGYLRRQLGVLSESLNFSYVDHGEYRFMRSSDGPGGGVLQGLDPEGGGFEIKELKKVWIHKENNDGVEHDVNAFNVGEILKLTHNGGDVLFSITGIGPGNANNSELDLEWITGGEKDTLNRTDLLRVQEGFVPVPVDLLQENNTWQGTNSFEDRVTLKRKGIGSGEDFTIYGQVKGSTSTVNDLFQVYRNAVTTDGEDAVNYFGRQDTSTNITTVATVQRLIQEALDAQPEVTIPKFATVPVIDVFMLEDFADAPLGSQAHLLPMNNSDVYQKWPGNVQALDFYIGDNYHNLDLTMGGQFYLATPSGAMALYGFVLDVEPVRTVSGVKAQKFYIRKQSASGTEFQLGQNYKLYTSGMWWSN